jgi:hypothetical protein
MPLMAKLVRTASGTRHYRWALEIAATLHSHLEYNYLLSETQKQALAAEAPGLDALVQKLQNGVVPYRNFIDTAYIKVRAGQRVADFLCDEAQREADGHLRPRKKDIDSILSGGYGAIFSKNPLSRVLSSGREKTVELARRAATMLRTLPASIRGATEMADALDKAASLLHSFNVERRDVVSPQREPLKAAVQKSIYELREGLDQMDGRLRTHFSQDFINSLYPELTKKGIAVADEDDEDDDTSGPPDEAAT